MQNYAIDMHGREWSNGCVEHEQWRFRQSAHPPILKGTLVFVFLALLGVIAVASIVLAIVEVVTDGHRRVDERRLVRIF
jgi:hypothetical protein